MNAQMNITNGGNATIDIDYLQVVDQPQSPFQRYFVQEMTPALIRESYNINGYYLFTLAEARQKVKHFDTTGGRRIEVYKRFKNHDKRPDELVLEKGDL